MKVQSVFVALLLLARPATGATVSLSVDADTVVGRVDERIYSHFLEHIYHSVNGGLWGNAVWSPSFEAASPQARWVAEDGAVAQRTHVPNARLLFGDSSWTDYELTLDAQKMGGTEGFLVFVRASSDEDWYRFGAGSVNNTGMILEKGTSTDHRWGQVAGRTGGVESGRWYRIRIRCEGPRIQAWLDDQLLVDFTDTETPHPSGRVGLGTWNTSARFRNLRVTSLDGKVLWEGLPGGLEPADIAPDWKRFGDGRFEWTTDNPLNGDYCQMVEPASGEAGVTSMPLSVKAVETYRGSIWLRAEGGANVVVRLRDGEKTLAESRFAALSAVWREFPLVLKPSSAASEAVLQIGVTGPGRVWTDQVSLVPDAAARVGGWRPDLLKSLHDLKPPLIRWPGGTFVKWYRWKDAIGPRHLRRPYPLVVWDDKDVTSVGTDEFIALCRRLGAEPCIVVNIGEYLSPDRRAEMLQEAKDWVEYCNGPADSRWGKVRAANGHPEPYRVKHWEIDNETWGMGVAAYAQAVREFSQATRQVDPNIAIAVCGSQGRSHGEFGYEWNEALLKACASSFDLLSLHHYEEPAGFADGPAKFEAFLGDTAALIAASRNPGVKLFVSEWGAVSTDWRSGLYTAGVLNAFERSPQVAITTPAVLMRNVRSEWDNAFINFDHRTWFGSPAYVVEKLWREHYAPDRLEVSGDAGTLNMIVTRSADGRRLVFKAVNPTGEALEVRLSITGFRAAKARMWLVAPDGLGARNTLGQPTAVRPLEGRAAIVTGAVHFTMPRWSAGVVELST